MRSGATKNPLTGAEAAVPAYWEADGAPHSQAWDDMCGQRDKKKQSRRMLLKAERG